MSDRVRESVQTMVGLVSLAWLCIGLQACTDEPINEDPIPCAHLLDEASATGPARFVEVEDGRWTATLPVEVQGCAVNRTRLQLVREDEESATLALEHEVCNACDSTQQIDWLESGRYQTLDETAALATEIWQHAETPSIPLCVRPFGSRNVWLAEPRSVVLEPGAGFVSTVTRHYAGLPGLLLQEPRLAVARARMHATDRSAQEAVPAYLPHALCEAFELPLLYVPEPPLLDEHVAQHVIGDFVPLDVPPALERMVWEGLSEFERENYPEPPEVP